MVASEFFTAARLKEMRDEICTEGFAADNFLADAPDCPVFGVNLACLYPFPAKVRHVYESLAERLAAIDPAVYVYPFWETHVTIATFINFTRHISPTPQSIAELKSLMSQVAAILESFVRSTNEFDLWVEQPVIARKAAILPLSDPEDAIKQIRHALVERLGSNPSLRSHLEDLGLNIPPLVHSTILRFKNVPANTQQFLLKFDEISRTVPRVAMRVEEIYITTETKPYMRAGEIVHRFPCYHS